MFKKITSAQKNILTASLVILMAVFFTLPFVSEFTLADYPEAPDRTAVYTLGRITWSDGTTSYDDTSATLGIFGEAQPGEELPLIKSDSKGTYRLRFTNDVSGTINCFMYVYCENPHSVPLAFDLEAAEGMTVIPEDEYPALGDGVTVLCAANGEVRGGRVKDFTLNWKWDSVSDEKDTQLGVKAADEDVTYTIKVMFVVEDYNRYKHNREIYSETTVFRHSNYVYGYPDGSFRPNNNITRAETAAILSRMIDTSGISNAKDDRRTFPDVSADYWAYNEITELARCGVIKGYPDGNFGPNDPITRAEFAALCVRITELSPGIKIEKAKLGFADFSSSHWSYDTVAKAVKDGIVEGYDDNTFRPEAKITRAEAVTMTNRMLLRTADTEAVDKKAEEGLEFPDARDSSYWAYYEIYEAAYSHLYRIQDGKERWLD